MKRKIQILCILMTFLLTVLPTSVFAEEGEAEGPPEAVEQNPVPPPEAEPEPVQESTPEPEPVQEPAPEPTPEPSSSAFEESPDSQEPADDAISEEGGTLLESPESSETEESAEDGDVQELTLDAGTLENDGQEPEDGKAPEGDIEYEETGGSEDIGGSGDTGESENTEKSGEEELNDVADDPEDGVGEVPTFVLNTPEDLHITFGTETQSIGFVSVSDVKGLKEGERIMLHISEPAFVNVNDPSQTIPLSITDADGNDVICLGGYDIPEQPVEIFLHITAAAWQQAASGSYAAKIAYDASIENE